MTDLQEPRRRALLPFLDLKRHGNRSHVTCFYKCGNACDSAIPNQSDNPTFADVVQTAFSRRSMLKAAGVGALVVAAGPLAPSPAAAHQRPPGARGSAGWRADLPAGRPEPAGRAGDGEGYRYSVVMRWGDPVVFGAPEFDIARQTPEAQAQQFGYNCDYIGLLPLDDKDREALLVEPRVHQRAADVLGVASESSPTTPQQKRIAMMATGSPWWRSGGSATTGEWRPPATASARITADDPDGVHRPRRRLGVPEDQGRPPRATVGTLNNCAGGPDAAGTRCTARRTSTSTFVPAASPRPACRPGRRLPGTVSAKHAAGAGGHEVPRFDLAAEPNEVNRFGWVVEVDPYDPTSRPKKRTAMGRFKHEGANVRIAEDGRVVAYSGDDERFDYIYKFVSKKKYRPGNDRASRAHNLTLLDEGDSTSRSSRRLAAGRDHRHRGP